MIPSGYKEDTVFSQIPTDGSGDLSFTRASNGTRINSAGLVEVCPWNLIDNSEQFDNVIWVKQNGIAVTANTTTAPNGTTTADTLEKASGSGGVGFYYIVTSTNSFEQLTNFFYVKAKSGSGIIWLLGKNTGTFAFFDVINGTALSKSSGMTTSVESVGNGWYKCIFSQSYVGASSTEFGIGLCLVDGTPNYDATSAATQSVYIWGAQSAVGNTAKPYFPTTDRLNVPRLTYQNGGGGCPSLLLEKQSTNVLLYSNTGDWGASGTITKTYNTTDLLSPDGTNNATKVVSSAGTGDTSVGFSVADGAVTVSFWGKVASGTKTLVLDVRNNSSAVVSSSPVLTTEWQRFTLTNTVSGTGSSGAVWIYPNGAGTFYIYGAQAESSSYATSLILTNGASATRVADVCFKTGISSLIGQTEGTIFAEGSAISTGSGIAIANSGYLFAISDNTLNNQISIRLYPFDGNYYLQVRSGGAVVAGTTYSPTSVGQNVKIAIAYKANDFAFYVNGTQIATVSSGAVPALSAVNFGQFVGPLDAIVNQKQAALFKTRLTNAELASLTTI